MRMATSVMRAQQILLARYDELLKPHGLTFARYEVLVLLRFSRYGALPLGRIGERLMVHPTSVTNSIDGRRGIRRSQSERPTGVDAAAGRELPTRLSLRRLRQHVSGERE